MVVVVVVVGVVVVVVVVVVVHEFLFHALPFQGQGKYGPCGLDSVPFGLTPTRKKHVGH